MLPILILIAIVAFLGFMLAWVTGMVAKEEISVGQGMAVVFLTAIVNFFARLGLLVVGLEPLVANIIDIPISALAMAGLLRLIGGIDFKPGLIIGAVYAVALFLVNLGLAAVFS